MKKILIPLVISLSVLLILELADFSNPIYYLTNDFYIEGYQATSQNEASNEIVIVNISDFSTDEIKDQVYILSKYNPSVIGLDYFLSDTTSIDTEPIQFKNTVLPILIDLSDSIRFSKNSFTNYAEYGFIRIYSPTLFEPFIEINKKKYSSFATKILELHDPSRYNQLLKRRNEKEVINYSGNISNFIYLGDLTKIKNLEALKEIEGKIVLLGYTGIDTTNPTLTDNYDSYDTPKGKMFGVVMLANIIHTLLDHYITPASLFVMAPLIVALVLLNIFTPYAFSKSKAQYWIIKAIQLIEIVIAFMISSYVVHQWNIYLDYELISFTIILIPEISYWYSYRKVV